jgi:hypothetical protein
MAPTHCKETDVNLNLRALISATAAGLCCTCAMAADTAMTTEEFQSSIVGKTIRMTLDDGKTYDLLMAAGGKATVYGPYNDVGTWRADGPGGYCTRWNKQALAENCARFVTREGKLTILRPDGSLRGTVLSLQ